MTYTKGTEGNPRQELVDMLKYIEKTTDDNVTNQDIASIQRLENNDYGNYKKQAARRNTEANGKISFSR